MLFSCCRVLERGHAHAVALHPCCCPGPLIMWGSTAASQFSCGCKGSVICPDLHPAPSIGCNRVQGSGSRAFQLDKGPTQAASFHPPICVAPAHRWFTKFTSKFRRDPDFLTRASEQH